MNGTDNFLIYSLLYIYLYPTGVVYFTSYIIVIFSNIYIYILFATCMPTHILFATCNVHATTHATKAGRKREKHTTVTWGVKRIYIEMP